MLNLFKKKQANDFEVLEVVEVAQVETAEDRSERAAMALCSTDPEFANKFDQAIKIILDDRIMMARYRKHNAEGQPELNYADARRALLTIARQVADGDSIDTCKYTLCGTVERTLNEGRRFRDVADVEKAMHTYRKRG